MAILPGKQKLLFFKLLGANKKPKTITNKPHNLFSLTIPTTKEARYLPCRQCQAISGNFCFEKKTKDLWLWVLSHFSFNWNVSSLLSCNEFSGMKIIISIEVASLFVVGLWIWMDKGIQSASPPAILTCLWFIRNKLHCFVARKQFRFYG